MQDRQAPAVGYAQRKSRAEDRFRIDPEPGSDRLNEPRLPAPNVPLSAMTVPGSSDWPMARPRLAV